MQNDNKIKEDIFNILSQKDKDIDRITLEIEIYFNLGTDLGRFYIEDNQIVGFKLGRYFINKTTDELRIQWVGEDKEMSELRLKRFYRNKKRGEL